MTTILSFDSIENARLDDFQSTQLRDLYIAHFKSPEKVPRSKVELVEALKDEVSQEDFRTLLGRLEATQSFRHLYLFAFASPVTGKQLHDSLQSWSNQLNLPFPFPLSETGLHYLGALDHPYPLIRLAHAVRNKIYVPAGEGMLKLVDRSFRHPIVIAIKPDQGIVEVRFNGFEQSKDTPSSDRISYQTIAEECRSFIQEVFAVPVKGMQLKSSIEKMLIAHPKEVGQVKNISRVGGGRVSIDAGDTEESQDFSEFLQSAFKLKDGSPIAAMSSWTAEHITLRWHELKVATRIDLTGQTPELLFLWKGTHLRSLESIDLIIKRLIEFADLSFSLTRVRLSEAVQNFAQSVFTVFDLAQLASAPYEDTLGYLLEKTSTPEISMRFRIKSDEHLHEMTNDWRLSLSDIPRIIETESGKRIDTTNPKSIEVGFVRNKVDA
ncbi:hypothetical protein [Duganella sp. HH105]|uniref:hypothetical protein n=1 Tax=Duganella sp. HH105 TaxID=1781067 RepID=UPI00114C8FC9|nr:hypothetical protein [Duganella sp. HH105]